MENREDKILFLGGGWNCFSNMSSYMVEFRGELFPTSEHAYQYFKFDDLAIREQIKNARSAFDAKMLAIKYADKKLTNWHEMNLSLMEEIIRAKLAQHPHILKKLIETGNREIIEASKDDSFWGWGADQQGQNTHGKIWMKLREEVKSGLWN